MKIVIVNNEISNIYTNVLQVSFCNYEKTKYNEEYKTLCIITKENNEKLKHIIIITDCMHFSITE